MKEIKAIIKAYNQIDFSQTRAALATVSRVEGSSYRRAGARMLIMDNGSYIGGISGGCLEGDALRRAQKAISLNTPSVVTYDTTQDDNHQIGVGLGCNGIIDVLFTPLFPEDAQNPVQLLSAVAETRVPRVALTFTNAGTKKELLGKMFLYEDQTSFLKAFPQKELSAAVAQHIQDCLSKRISQTFDYQVEGETYQVFIEVILPATQLIIFGGNYDIYPLVRIAAELGWQTTVVMNIAKADKSLFTIASKVLHNKGAEQPDIDEHTAVVLMAHDMATDYSNLLASLQTNALYIGLLGPRKRTQKMLDRMITEGRQLSSADEQRIFSPAGLDIGAITPEEIAVSIVAEIRANFAGRQGMPLRQRQGTIHGNENLG